MSLSAFTLLCSTCCVSLYCGVPIETSWLRGIGGSSVLSFIIPPPACSARFILPTPAYVLGTNASTLTHHTHNPHTDWLSHSTIREPFLTQPAQPVPSCSLQLADRITSRHTVHSTGLTSTNAVACLLWIPVSSSQREAAPLCLSIVAAATRTHPTSLLRLFL